MSLKAQIKELTEQLDGLANVIKEFMGESGHGESEGFRVSWTSSTRRSFDSKRFAAENPDIDLKNYYNESTTRTFRVAKRKGV
jgi:predicted phage-related endonuclease